MCYTERRKGSIQLLLMVGKIKEYVLMECLAMVSLEEFMVIGFWQTKATLYIDIVVTYLILLPFLMALSIYSAIRESFKIHQVSQFVLFTLSIFTLGVFAYYVHFIIGFDTLIQSTQIETLYAYMLLILHIIIAIVMLVLWFFTLMYALSDYKRRALPGVYSESHRRFGKRVFLSVVLNAVSTGVLYWVFFSGFLG